MKTFAILLALVGVVTANAQAPDFGGKKQIEKMRALSFLKGYWVGEATLTAQGRTIKLTGFEDVQAQAGGTCLMVNAKWSMRAGDRDIAVHEPCAMIFWDEAKNSYRMMAQLANGLRNEFTLDVKDKGYVWMMTDPNGVSTRYTMNLTSDGAWHEVGEHQGPDGKWEKAFDMRLKPAVKSSSDSLVVDISTVGVPAQASGPATKAGIGGQKFDPKRDAAKDISDAIKTATSENKKIILDVGGEWCIWCKRLDALFTSNAEIGNLLKTNYIVVKVNFSPENENKDVLSKYPKINGYPHLFVLDKAGKLIHSQDTGLLETGDHHAPEKVIAFLKKWAL